MLQLRRHTLVLLNSEGDYSLEILATVVHSEPPASSHQDRVAFKGEIFSKENLPR